MNLSDGRLNYLTGAAPAPARSFPSILFLTMPSEKKLRIKTLVMVFALVVCANIGDLTLKRGMTLFNA
ncbi:MAG: hypothetical protein ABI833_23220, partial [Acidobacteriota bacterium]